MEIVSVEAYVFYSIIIKPGGMHLKLKFLFETMELDGQVVAVPIGTNVEEFRGVIKMNETAARILELLKNDISEDDIINKLMNEYDASRELISDDVRKCISEFQSKGILEL